MFYLVIYDDGDMAIWKDSDEPNWVIFHCCPKSATGYTSFITKMSKQVIMAKSISHLCSVKRYPCTILKNI